MHNESWGKMHRIAKSSKLELLSVRITMGSTTAAACAQASEIARKRLELRPLPRAMCRPWPLRRPKRPPPPLAATQ